MLCCVAECTYVFAFKPIRLDLSSFGAAFVVVSYVRLGLSLETLLDPGWRFIQESLYGRVVFMSDEHTDEQAPIDDSVLQSTDYSDCIPGTTRISKHCDPVPCEPTIPPFWNDWRHHCLHYGHGPNATSFINVNSVPFLGVWYYRFQMMKSCLVTKNLTPMSDRELLVQHMVDIEKATAEFREASERKHATSSHMNSSGKRFPTRSIVQRRLSIYNWNPGPPSGKRRCLRTTNCRKVACHYLAGGV